MGPISGLLRSGRPAAVPSSPEPPLAARAASDLLPELDLRGYREGDEVEILATFNRVFAGVDPSFEPRDLASWRWRYLQNPGGWRMVLAVAEDGRVAGQYAGIGQRVWTPDGPRRFSQSVDSMVDPLQREGLSKQGLFVRIGRRFAEQYGGEGPGLDSVMWGLPVRSAWRIGHRFLGYQLVRRVLALEADPTAIEPGRTAGVEVSETRSVPEGIDELFERAVAGHEAAVVRDRSQLGWRFLECPEHRYEIAVARSPGRLRGLAVHRPGAFDGLEGGLVCDWLVGPDDGPARAALLGWLGERARARSAPRLQALLPDTAPDWLAFQRAGFRVRPTRYLLAARSYARGLPIERLRRGWYYTLGDTDLV